MSDIYQFNVGGTTYNLANLGLLAPVQITLTADRLYNTGDQFIYTGLLYEATETIAQGTSITIGSNAQLADCVTKQISEINSNLSPDYFGVNAEMNFSISSQTCIRFGKLCILQFTWDGTLTTPGDIIASVPNDHLPDVNAPLTTFRGSCGYFKDGVAVGTGVISLSKTGQITQGFTSNPANVNSGRAIIIYSMA